MNPLSASGEAAAAARLLANTLLSMTVRMTAVAVTAVPSTTCGPGRRAGHREAAHAADASAVVVYLPQKQTTLVILIKTDGEYQGGEASTALASAITKELTPNHIYTIDH
jgi:guanyl-specific ribonuclease Sa